MKKYFCIIVIILLSIRISYSQWQQTALNSDNFKSLIAIGNNIYAGGAGINKTTNGGVNWTTLSTMQSNSIAANGNNIFSCYNMSIYMTTNDGANWTVVRNTYDNALSLVSSGNAILAAQDIDHLLRTTDIGATWTNSNISNVRVLGANGNTVFARSNSGGVFVSANNGASFTSVTFPGSYPLSFAASGNDVYSGTINSGILHSTDNGITWFQTSFSSAHYVTALAVYGSNVFAGTADSSVYFSSNNGASWSLASDGMGNAWINSLLILNNNIYAGTNNYGVWKRELSEFLSVNTVSAEIPKSYSLFQNYPNPFNPSTKIKFGVPKSGEVKLIIYDAIGREAATIVDELLNPGTYEAEWNATDFPSGVYFYKLTSGNYSQTRKMVLIK